MAVIGWDEAAPSNEENAGLGDDRIRSLKSSLRIGLAEEHDWSSAGGEVGKHLRGSAKAYVGPQSAVSSAGTDGKLMITSDTSRLFGVGSSGTVLVGGANVMQVGAYPGTTPQRHYWCEEIGTDTTDSNGSVLLTITRSGFSGMPYVFVTQRTNSVNSAVVSLHATRIPGNTVNFVVTSISQSGPAFVPNIEFDWVSKGTRVL